MSTNFFRHEREAIAQFRDVPFSEVEGCHTPVNTKTERQWEKESRGARVRILVPAIPEGFINSGYIFQCYGQLFSVRPAAPCTSGCHGPFYKLIDFEGVVCEHLVEIKKDRI